MGRRCGQALDKWDKGGGISWGWSEWEECMNEYNNITMTSVNLTNQKKGRRKGKGKEMWLWDERATSVC